MRTIDEIKEYITGQGYGTCDDDKVILFDSPNYATAFIGMSDDGRAVYDYDRMVDFLVVNDKVTPVEAREFIDFNIIGFRSDPCNR